MKILLVENELNIREALKKMLTLILPDSIIVGETGYIQEAKQLIINLQPDIILLDIELEDGTGFELLESLEFSDFKVVFTTAYNQYAIKAFKFSAVDYLLKPIDPSDLKNTIEKITSIINNEKQQLALIETLRENLSQKNKKIVLKTSDFTHFISLDEIIRLEADGSYTLFITESKKIIVSKNLKYYEELLGGYFIRCHQSHIVNPTRIKSLDKKDNIIMLNGDTIPISSRKKSTTLQLINKAQRGL